MSTARFANAVKCHATDYIDFLIGSPRIFTCTEAAGELQREVCLGHVP